jgi:dTDP-4-dehydrorhamnose reductase
VSTSRPPLELWGGIECTVARVGDSYRDQSIDTGHHDRPDDLDRIAALGIRTLRYPLIWETITPSRGCEPDWSWHDERLSRMRELGIRPIATLCHHGSGPRDTSLLDPAFAEGLAGHAARVAERYPWIELYTPVNEPLTTARFSALYGHWYPHARDYGAFLRALVNECRATVLAMRAIREVRPDAALVQTDDLGKTFSTPLLAYQAEHDNDRRWLTFDLLCGRVGPEHPLFGFFIHWAKIDPADLAIFEPADAAPDIIGINHYLTSDRFLDQRYRRYPEHHWGSNGRHRFADAEAVRIDVPEAELGPAARMREVWERYRRPIAVTEVHHGCTRDEQLRWLKDVWDAARQVRSEGADIRAVTVWSMFGTVDWNTLLTGRNGIYEPGIFDVRGPSPRPTMLAKASAALAATGTFDHPVLESPGWWRRETRFYGHVKPPAACRAVGSSRRLLVTGATGTLGRAFSRLCDTRGLDHVLTSCPDLDIAESASVESALACHRPWAVINTAGDVRPSHSECEPDLSLREDAEGPSILARACAQHGIPLVTFSTDLVFDGARGPYLESDQVNPGSIYGRASAEGERQVIAAHPGALVIRAGAFFCPWDPYNFAFHMLRSLAAGELVEASTDVVSPTYLPDLAHVALDLLIDGEVGIWHLANPGSTSWSDFARRIAREAGLDPGGVTLQGGTGRNTALTSERGLLLPPLETTFGRFLRDCELDWRDRAVPAIAAE